VDVRLARRGRLWHTVAGAALVAVVAVGATIQGGLLGPEFRGNGGAGVSGVQFNTIQNVSWRSWTVTSVHFADSPTTRTVLYGRPLQLSLRRGPVAGKLGPRLVSVVVAPGQEVSVGLSNASRTCHAPSSDLQRVNRSVFSHEIPIPVVIAVQTPFGTKNVSVGPFDLQQC
jgi:hypothetical protein